jgi:hypothetical protein
MFWLGFLFCSHLHLSFLLSNPNSDQPASSFRFLFIKISTFFFFFTYNCFNQFIYSKKIKVWFQCDCVYLYSVKFLTYWKVQIVCPFCWLNLCLISEWICQNHIDSRWFCKSYIGKSRWITVILPTVIPNIYSGYEWKFESSSSLGEKSHLGMEILIILYNR